MLLHSLAAVSLHMLPSWVLLSLGGLFETVLGFFLKPLRRFFPPVVTGTVVLAIGLSLISVGVNSFAGGKQRERLRFN